ncbi:hypothetical protein [Vacuolonema iberomarrocanum]|uniref:hypothetical protein n=1 Tax=Vacuolonema iberomarrocanum TaxID=3454632 RepID=UPI003F6DAF36
MFESRLNSMFPLRPVIPIMAIAGAALLAGCESVTTEQYQASAVVTYTWYVDYETQGQGGADRAPRIEEFESTSLENKNGQRPDGAVSGPDERGLWWPATPPDPTVDELEARLRGQERIGRPRLAKNVEYRIIFRQPGEPNRTVPTEYSVYRQVVRAYEDRVPLQLTLDPTESRVTQARPAQ